MPLIVALLVSWRQLSMNHRENEPLMGRERFFSLFIDLYKFTNVVNIWYVERWCLRMRLAYSACKIRHLLSKTFTFIFCSYEYTKIRHLMNLKYLLALKRAVGFYLNCLFFKLSFLLASCCDSLFSFLHDTSRWDW